MVGDAALLVVDDNVDNCQILTRLLARAGYVNVVAAYDGHQALDLLRSRPFDLVLLDVMMPRLNGYQVLECLRQDGSLRDLPVIVISAIHEIESVVRCIELGAEDYLSKPFNSTLLRARVHASLEKKRLRDELAGHLARLERELRAARELQFSMAPRDFPVPTPERPVEIAAVLEPAEYVGGDLYDFFFPDRNMLCVLVADVSDKGIPAALYIARIKSLVRVLAALLGSATGRCAQPHEILTRLNDDVCRDNSECMFVTLFLATLDLRSGILTSCNAGHPRPYLLSLAGVSHLEGRSGTALGVDAGSAYESRTHALAPGEALFVFTDGVTEALNAEGALFSPERLEEAIREVAGQPGTRVLERVLNRVREFAGTAPQSDDIAALVVRRVS